MKKAIILSLITTQLIFAEMQLDTIEFANHYAMNLSNKFTDSSELTIEPYYKTFENLAIHDETNQYEVNAKHD